MKITIAFILLISSIISCGETRVVNETPYPIVTMEFSSSVDSAFRLYVQHVRSFEKEDSVLFGLFVEDFGVDSSIYSFHVYYGLNQISIGRNIILGVSYVDSIPVVVTMRSNELFLNYENANEKYNKFLANLVPQVAHVHLSALQSLKCTYYKGDSIKTIFTASSGVVPIASPK